MFFTGDAIFNRNRNFLARLKIAGPGGCRYELEVLHSAIKNRGTRWLALQIVAPILENGREVKLF